jgi:hypothetical protein
VFVGKSKAFRMVAALVDKCREEVILVRKRTLEASIFVSVLSLQKVAGLKGFKRQASLVPSRQTLITDGR